MEAHKTDSEKTKFKKPYETILYHHINKVNELGIISNLKNPKSDIHDYFLAD